MTSTGKRCPNSLTRFVQQPTYVSYKLAGCRHVQATRHRTSCPCSVGAPFCRTCTAVGVNHLSNRWTRYDKQSSFAVLSPCHLCTTTTQPIGRIIHVVSHWFYKGIIGMCRLNMLQTSDILAMPNDAGSGFSQTPCPTCHHATAHSANKSVAPCPNSTRSTALSGYMFHTCRARDAGASGNHDWAACHISTFHHGRGLPC